MRIIENVRGRRQWNAMAYRESRMMDRLRERLHQEQPDAVTFVQDFVRTLSEEAEDGGEDAGNSTMSENSGQTGEIKRQSGGGFVQFVRLRLIEPLPSGGGGTVRLFGPHEYHSRFACAAGQKESLLKVSIPNPPWNTKEVRNRLSADFRGLPRQLNQGTSINCIQHSHRIWPPLSTTIRCYPHFQTSWNAIHMLDIRSRRQDMPNSNRHPRPHRFCHVNLRPSPGCRFQPCEPPEPSPQSRQRVSWHRNWRRTR